MRLDMVKIAHARSRVGPNLRFFDCGLVLLVSYYAPTPASMQTNFGNKEGQHITMDSIIASGLSCPVFESWLQSF